MKQMRKCRWKCSFSFPNTNELTFMFFKSPNSNKIKQESDELRSYLKKSQDNVNLLLDEKRKMLETIRGLRVSIQKIRIALK